MIPLLQKFTKKAKPRVVKVVMEEETEIKVEVEEVVVEPLALVKRVEVEGEGEVTQFISKFN